MDIYIEKYRERGDKNTGTEYIRKTNKQIH